MEALRPAAHLLNRMFGIVILLGFMSTVACGTDLDDARAVLRAALADRENNSTAGVPQINSKMDKLVQGATTEQMQSLLELGGECLQTPGLRAQILGLLLMSGVTLRFSDGPQLLAPYLDMLTPFLNRPEEEGKGLAAWILGRINSPKALAYLVDHLADQNSSRDLVVTISDPLLKSRDMVYVQKVLTLVEQRPELKLKSDVINALGLYGVTTPEALKLIRDGLQDSTGETRRIAIDAVERLPKEVRKGFEPDLLKVMTIPNLDPKIRDRAQQVIIQ